MPRYCASCQHNEREEGDPGEEANTLVTGTLIQRNGRKSPFKAFMCSGHAEIVAMDGEYKGKVLERVKLSNIP